MKTRIKNILLVPLLIAAFYVITTSQVIAQSLTNLHNFTRKSDGAVPRATLILSGETLYGTASEGGDWDHGAVFAVNTDGSGFTTLYSFTSTSAPYYTNSDGAYPYARLLLVSNTLYGTTTVGGTFGYGDGTVFKVNTDSTGFEVLHVFADYPQDGADCYAPLVLLSNTLYGTTQDGGSSRRGTVFKVNTDGSDFAIVHSFAALSGGINGEGADPYAGLVLSGNRLYGTAYYGGSAGNGTVFAVNTDGSGFTNLHSFTAVSASLTNADGAYPYSTLILSGNTLYGTAYSGGSSSNGTVFALNTNGTGFKTLYNFPATSGGSATPTNSEGARPFAELTLSGNTLFGTTLKGGSSGWGTVFKINTDGTGFTVVHTFSGPYTGSDGGDPEGGLIFSGNTLYGATAVGGSSFWGTVFRLSLSPPPPQLIIIRSGADVVLSWPTNFAGFDYTGFTLQSTTNFVSPVWAAVSPAPVVVNSQNTVTNPASESQTFYRLSQ